MHKADIVVPVFNGLTHVKDCLSSLVEYTCPALLESIFVIDDASDRSTASYLAEQAKRYPVIDLRRNTRNLGFVASANAGLRLGSAPYIILVNSDVIVTPRWLDRLIACAESDPRIGSVNPLTNTASSLNIPLAPGANFFGMDLVLESGSARRYSDVVTGVGFCMLLRRAALEDVGLFDEVFGRGYCEDSDLCMRLVSKGWRTVVSDDVYVYHRGRGSFADRDERYRANRKIFDQRWADEYRRQFARFRKADPLRPSRELFAMPCRWDPIPSMRETYRRMRGKWRESDPVGAGKEAVKGLLALPRARREVVTPSIVSRLTRPDRLRVTYVIHALSVAGGTLSVVQLVSELILLGVEARIATLAVYPEIYQWKFLGQPMVFKSWSEMQANLPETDVIVATHWSTVTPVREALEGGKAKVAAYFVQAYEPWFFPETDQAARDMVRRTYRMIPNKIVKSEWLRNLLRAEEGCDATKIRLGMDLGVFYPREVRRDERPVILAMARPRTPRRGFSDVVEALRLVKEARPAAEIILFGDDLSAQTIPFPYRDEGVIVNQNRLAELYSSADVFLDASLFQGFGRTALEAMACGAACVLTGVGGVTEYARDEENCLVIPPGAPTAAAQAILRLLDDRNLKERLIRAGQSTVQDYCHKREARETAEYFKSLLGRVSA